jgi:hypothetical protein
MLSPTKWGFKGSVKLSILLLSTPMPFLKGCPLPQEEASRLLQARSFCGSTTGARLRAETISGLGATGGSTSCIAHPCSVACSRPAATCGGPRTYLQNSHQHLLCPQGFNGCLEAVEIHWLLDWKRSGSVVNFVHTFPLKVQSIMGPLSGPMMD